MQTMEVLSPEVDQAPLLWVWRARWKSTALLHDVTFFFSKVHLLASAHTVFFCCFNWSNWLFQRNVHLWDVLHTLTETLELFVIVCQVSTSRIFFHAHKIHLSIGRNCHIWWFLFRCNLLSLLLLELIRFWRNLVFKRFYRDAALCDAVLSVKCTGLPMLACSSVTLFDQTDFDSAERCFKDVTHTCWNIRWVGRSLFGKHISCFLSCARSPSVRQKLTYLPSIHFRRVLRTDKFLGETSLLKISGCYPFSMYTICHLLGKFAFSISNLCPVHFGGRAADSHKVLLLHMHPAHSDCSVGTAVLPCVQTDYCCTDF